MALHTDLPIYKVAYDLLDAITNLAKNMPRDFKQSIGGKLRDEAVEITVLIFRANCAQEKAPPTITITARNLACAGAGEHCDKFLDHIGIQNQ